MANQRTCWVLIRGGDVRQQGMQTSRLVKRTHVNARACELWGFTPALFIELDWCRGSTSSLPAVTLMIFFTGHAVYLGHSLVAVSEAAVPTFVTLTDHC